jgi:CheY-like chemotaxis protein
VDKLLSGRRVLVVEDELLLAMMIEDMLTDLGCEAVTTVGTVDEALALIDAHVFNAAMLDMNLNGNTSHSVAEALVARGVPFIYSTGNNSGNMKPGFQGHPVLKKPIKYEQLVEILTHLLSR